MLDGFLQHLAKSRKGGYVVWAVPFADIDGVAEGAYGKDRYPYDLNRAWSLPAMRHEVHLIQQDMRRWASRCRPILALDLHAPGGCEHAGVYAFAGDEAEGPAAVEETKWCNVLQNELQAEFAAAEFRKTAAYASRWATPRFRDFAGKELGLPALTLETPYALVNNAVLTQKSYREIGRRLALGIFRRNG